MILKQSNEERTMKYIKGYKNVSKAAATVIEFYGIKAIGTWKDESKVFDGFHLPNEAIDLLEIRSGCPASAGSIWLKTEPKPAWA